MGLSIIAACLPTLRPLFNNMPHEGLSRIFHKLSSLRLTTSSLFGRGESSKYRKDSEITSTSSYTRFANITTDRGVATEIYNMRDIEAQARMPLEGIMVSEHISHFHTVH